MIALVTGGARSGKSRFAENLYKGKKDVVYIATSKVCDDEMQERVKLHQQTRPKEWRTFEGNYNLQKAIGEEENYLLDCVTVLTANIMFDISKDIDYIDFQMQNEIENKVIFQIENLINDIKEKNYNLLLVTNEVGDSIVPEHHVSRVFRDIQGRVNQRIATLVEEVYLVCCGIPVKIK